MNALHRLIVAVSGQPDAWATPINEAPGLQHVDTHEAWKLWGRPGSGCSGAGCNQGRSPDACDCGDSELACDVPPDADRVIQPPDPLPDDVRSRLKRRALYLSALGLGAIAGLLEAFGATDMPRLP